MQVDQFVSSLSVILVAWTEGTSIRGRTARSGWSAEIVGGQAKIRPPRYEHS